VKRGVVFFCQLSNDAYDARAVRRESPRRASTTRLDSRGERKNALVEPPSDAHLFYPLAFITLPLSDARFFFDASETDASSNSTQSGALSLS